MRTQLGYGPLSGWVAIQSFESLSSKLLPLADLETHETALAAERFCGIRDRRARQGTHRKECVSSHSCSLRAAHCSPGDGYVADCEARPLASLLTASSAKGMKIVPAIGPS